MILVSTSSSGSWLALSFQITLQNNLTRMLHNFILSTLLREVSPQTLQLPLLSWRREGPLLPPPTASCVLPIYSQYPLIIIFCLTSCTDSCKLNSFKNHQIQFTKVMRYLTMRKQFALKFTPSAQKTQYLWSMVTYQWSNWNFPLLQEEYSFWQIWPVLWQACMQLWCLQKRTTLCRCVNCVTIWRSFNLGLNFGLNFNCILDSFWLQ